MRTAAQNVSGVMKDPTVVLAECPEPGAVEISDARHNSTFILCPGLRI